MPMMKKNRRQRMCTCGSMTRNAPVTAATAPEADPQTFHGPGGFANLKGHPGACRPVPAAQNAADCQRLWQVSAELCGR